MKKEKPIKTFRTEKLKDVVVVNGDIFSERQASDLSQRLKKFVIILPGGVDGFSSLNYKEVEDILEAVKAAKQQK